MAKDLDPTARLVRHMEYCRKRDWWAQRGIKLAQGKGRAALRAAKKAAKKAEEWEAKVKALEP